MILKSVFWRTFGLVVVTLTIFFVVQIFFYNERYFEISMMINAFVYPFLFTLTGFWGIWVELKHRPLGFKDAFKTSFVPMFLAGMISILVMFVYFNYINPEAERTFQIQRLEKHIENAQGTEHFEIIKKTLKSEKLRNEHIFSFQNTMIFGALLLLFYAFISALLASLLRTSNQNKK